MNILVTSLGDTPLLEMQGDIDHSTCGAFGAAFDEVLGRGCPIVLLDLTRVTYLDSGGIGVLLSGARRLRGVGWLGVIGPNQNVHRLLEIVGLFLDSTFRAFADRSSAEAAIARSTGA